ncbi:hypothetical protein BDV59DRAFT_197146 [Aspergillus ambiguus]|uniref:uncharacterized protein n=1 Tax=Aspergillus ambiguus TaxID=176160 RepID=UPI003CCE175D
MSSRESSPSSGQVHPMRLDLDDGCLNVSHRDRDFTMFLDLSQAHHSDFITKVKQTVQKYGYKWEELRDKEQERRNCADAFTTEFGPLYWGTPEGRKKYLDPAALKRTSELCVYPDCKEEIIGTLMILLERKAKAHCRNEKQAETAERPAEKTLPTPKENPVKTEGSPEMTISSTKKRERKRNKKKKRETEGNAVNVTQMALTKSTKTVGYTTQDEKSRFVESRAFPTRKRSMSTPRDILPFSVIASVTPDSSPSSKKRKLGHDEETVRPPAAAKPLEQDEEGKFWKYAKFLVSSSNQQMAPVWVPFSRFISSSMFLAHMADECRTPEMDYNQKVDNESLNWPTATPAQVVVAASIKFEWSGFEIRVRQGQDRDLEYVMEELENTWKNVKDEEKMEGGLTHQFKILVMLHMVG